MNFGRLVRGGAVKNFFAAVVVVAAGLAANGLRGALLDDSSSIGLYLAAFWLLTPIVLTPLLVAYMPSASSEPPYFLVPLAATIAVACAIASATVLLRGRLGRRAGFAAFGGATVLAVLVGAASPAMELRFSF